MSWQKINKTTLWVKDLDRKLIDLCDKAGYEAITVSVEDECVPRSTTFTFGPTNSIFAAPDKINSSLLFDICKTLGVSAGCSNGNQHQLNSDCGLTKSAYKKEKNEWYYKVDKSEVAKVATNFGL